MPLDLPSPLAERGKGVRQMSRLRRALLFMPGDSIRKIEKGATLGVDSLIMDLEDGVALSQKATARQTVVDALRSLDFGRSERLIRINALSTPFFQDDLTRTLGARPDGYVIPKVENAQQVLYVSHWLDVAESDYGFPPGAIRLIVIIESALGVINLREIASADPRVVALAFGAEDFASSIGATRTAIGTEVLYARSAVVTYAAAFGLQAIDTPFVTLQDDDGLARDAETAAQMGYTGKLAIHPRQIVPIERAFNPGDAAIAYARRVLAANLEQQSNGTGVFELDGRMIDNPMVRTAETVLMRARAAGLIREDS